MSTIPRSVVAEITQKMFLIFELGRFMPFQFVVAGLLFASIQPLPLLAFTNPQLVSQLSPKPFTSQMEVFNRELDRAEQLYDNLMFEEGDRVADMTIARINGFLAANATIEGVDEIENVYTARVNQLKQLKAFKSVARAQMEQEGAANYDRQQALRERKLREKREHQYRMAVEARRAAEARASRWWSVWYGRPYTPILIYP